ncbi:hypothetical protein HK103_005703 [Boothiomyces macroporosus]|uniref:Major facilitator superfamily (MFS) profile domain-containing protein n=1 Tax=Boothiomyces macroporosus TaxID=261099 RepID=A0AAD5Y7M0_9FUNG|nr:hypothetical protein HK103_005703 [Boothiomyces macroporosus]
MSDTVSEKRTDSQLNDSGNKLKISADTIIETDISKLEKGDNCESKEKDLDHFHSEETIESSIEPSKSQFLIVFIGLFLIVFMAALDSNIIAIAIPSISKEFQSLSEVPWLFTGFLVGNTAFVPSYGKLADIFGRKAMVITAVTIFELGSLLCGFAVNMKMLIFARTLQGVGGGGVVSLSLIVISDMVSVQERPKYQSIISAAFGVATIVGPLVGGIITETLTWRWNFFLNLPFGLIAAVVCLLFMNLRELDRRSWRVKLVRVDFLGTFLLVSGVVMLLIPVQGGGTQFAWDSPTVITMLSISGVLLILFVYSQWKWAFEPLIPLRLFSNRHTAAPFVSTFFFGMTVTPPMFYTPLYFQIILNHDPLAAGEDTLPLLLSTIVCVIFSGMFIAKTGYYLPLLLFGSATAGVGMFLLSTMDEYSLVWQRIVYLIISGSGMGLCIQTILIACQLSVEEKDLSIVTALKSFWQTIGSVFGLAIVSTYFNNMLGSNIRDVLIEQNWNGSIQTLVDTISSNPLAIRSSNIPSELVAPLVHAVVLAFQKTFLICIPFAGLTFISALFCNWKPMEMKR